VCTYLLPETNETMLLSSRDTDTASVMS
jgi:hypothetical protein